jgi:hypothetical protein
LEVAEIDNENFRVPRAPHNPFLGLSEANFIKNFRLSKNLCMFLIETLERFMRPKRRATDLDIQTRVLVALNFYASGSYQPIIGCSKYLDVSQPSVCRAIKEVTNALNNPENLTADDFGCCLICYLFSVCRVFFINFIKLL